MNGKQELLDWFEHRAGLAKLEQLPPTLQYFTKALENSPKGQDFAQKYGQRDVVAFVGFVDLVGFSERVKGMEPSEVDAYLQPFFEALLAEISDNSGLVDKTIGDEIMFIVPDLDDDGGVPAILTLPRLLAGVCLRQEALGDQYQLKFGLAFGRVHVSANRGGDYTEHSVVGEVVNLAKRLCGIPEMQIKHGVGGAFGVLSSEDGQDVFETVLSQIAWSGGRFESFLLEEQPVLKGIGSTQTALLINKGSGR